MEKKSGIVVALALAAIAVLVFGGLPAVADEAESQADATVTQTAGSEADDMPVSVAGMTVFIDRETGEFRPPTAEEAAVLSAAIQNMFGSAARSAAPLAPRSFAGGAVGVDLGLSQLAFSVATVGVDGAIAHECARTPDEAEAHIHNQVSVPEEK